MTSQTRLSAKGQVVIPKDVRDRLGLVEGMMFDVIDRGDEVVLRIPAVPQRISVDEAQRRIRRIFTYDGPPLTDADLAAVGPRTAVARYRKLDEKPRK